MSLNVLDWILGSRSTARGVYRPSQSRQAPRNASRAAVASYLPQCTDWDPLPDGGSSELVQAGFDILQPACSNREESARSSLRGRRTATQQRTITLAKHARRIGRRNAGPIRTERHHASRLRHQQRPNPESRRTNIGTYTSGDTMDSCYRQSGMSMRRASDDVYKKKACERLMGVVRH